MANPPNQTRPITPDECLQDVLPGYLHRSHITLLTGPPYVGKSRFLLWLAHHLALGVEGFWGKLPPLKVLFCTERSRAMVMTQMQGLGLQLPTENLKFFTLADALPTKFDVFHSTPLQSVERECANFKPDIIILDTLVHFLPLLTENAKPTSNRGVNDYGSMAEKLMRLQIWAYHMGAAILAVHHTAKEREGEIYNRVLEKTLGSQAIMGNTASAWNLSARTDAPSEDGVLYLDLHAYTHAAIRPANVYLKVCYNKPIEICTQAEADAAVPPPENDKQPKKRTPEEEATLRPLQWLILGLIPDEGEVTRAWIMEHTDQHPSHPARQNVHRAINKLLERKQIEERHDKADGHRYIHKKPSIQ